MTQAPMRHRRFQYLMPPASSKQREILLKSHSEYFNKLKLTYPVRRIECGPEPEVLGLAAVLALGHRDIIIGEGAGRPGQRELVAGNDYEWLF